MWVLVLMTRVLPFGNQVMVLGSKDLGPKGRKNRLGPFWLRHGSESWPKKTQQGSQKEEKGRNSKPRLAVRQVSIREHLVSPSPLLHCASRSADLRQWAFGMCLEQAAGAGLRQKRNQDLNHILSPFVRQRCRKGDQGGFKGGGSRCTAFLRQTCRSVLGHFGDEKIMGLGEAVSVMDALCHGSHIDKCYHDSVGTSVHLKGSLSVEERELKS
ncbi:unnamed protein product [Prunus armeniaca]|uniref:Uncharacterized protein n=1 Tax=Prunus armeniaca TaxID=36596 RepID=A0A6J5UVT4_PRUAR|nr:unnamed protein product [Prunus armeniaca]